MRRRGVWPLIIVIAFVLALTAGFFLLQKGRKEEGGSPQGITPSPAGKIQVVTSINVLADLARNVGGDRVEVRSLTTGMENEHTFSPSVKALQAVARADLFVKVGLGMEPWAEKLVRGAGNKRLMVLDTSQVVTKLETKEVDVEETTSEEHRAGGEPHLGGEEGHEHAANPHTWLSPENAEKMVQAIAAALGELRPADAAVFAANACRYSQEIRKLKERLAQEVAGLPTRKVCSFSAAYPYLFQAFGFQEVARVEEFHGQEPSAKHVAEVIGIMRREKVRVLTADKQFSPQLPRAIARETGAKLVFLTPLLGGLPGTDTYLDLIDANVSQLIEALRE